MYTVGMQVEQVRRILEGGAITTRGRVNDTEIRLALSAANAGLIKAQYYDTILKLDGETIPDGAMIATYENIPVKSRDKGRSRIAMPATPMMMPDRMGVFSVYPSGRPDLEFIPNAPGQINLLMREKLLSTVARKTYTWAGKELTVEDDLIGSGISTVDIQLVVMDLGRLDEHDLLPMPDDLALQAVAQVLQLYVGTPSEQRADNKEPNPQNNGQ